VQQAREAPAPPCGAYNLASVRQRILELYRKAMAAAADPRPGTQRMRCAGSWGSEREERDEFKRRERERSE
jgi:hypothetical protein